MKTINQPNQTITSISGIESVAYSYHSKKYRDVPCFHYQINMPETTGSNDNFNLHQNQLDSTEEFVVVKFHLSAPADIELILMDSKKIEVMVLLDKHLTSGDYEIITDIPNDELRKFNYYYKLNVDGVSKMRKMEYIH